MWVMLAGNVLEAPELESLGLQEASQNDRPIQA